MNFVSSCPTFSNDPPVDCGRTHGKTAGISCAITDYTRQVFSISAIVDTFKVASTCWDPTPVGNIQRLTVPDDGRLMIVGDTHGQLEDVLWMFFKYGVPSRTNQYLFNGDIVDRGGHALEILLLLLCFIRDYPGSVFLIGVITRILNVAWNLVSSQSCDTNFMTSLA